MFNLSATIKSILLIPTAICLSFTALFTSSNLDAEKELTKNNEVLLTTPPGVDYTQQPLTFTFENAGTIQLGSTVDFDSTTRWGDFEYSTDNGANWIAYNANGKNVDNVAINVPDGGTVMFKGNIKKNQVLNQYSLRFVLAGTGCKVTVSGNINSIYDKTNYQTLTSLTYESCYGGLFQNCSLITNIDNLKLPATSLSAFCYANMFYDCEGLTTVPKDLLPATTLARSCYEAMFYSCGKLANPVDLPALELKDFCYRNMYSGSNYIRADVTQAGNYQIEYKIPSSGTITSVGSNSLDDMFGYHQSPVNTPSINTTYYMFTRADYVIDETPQVYTLNSNLNSMKWQFSGTNASLFNATHVSYSAAGANKWDDYPNHAGVFDIKIEREGNDYFNPYSKVIANGLTINKKTIEIIWPADNYQYTGSVQTITAQYKDAWNNTKYLTVTTDNTFKEPGTYTATASFKTTSESNNYNLPAVATNSYTIGPKEITILWDEDNFQYSGSTQTIKAQYQPISGSKVDLNVSVDSTFKDLGNYVATASFATPGETSYYKLPTTVTKNYTMKPKEVSVNWSADNYAYDGTEQSVTATYKNAAGADVPLTVSINSTFKNAGSYTATASDPTDTNYVLSNSSKTKAYTMQKKTVVIDWCADNYSYNHSIQTITASYKNISNVDVPLTVTTNNTFKDGGNYTATASEPTDANYKLPATKTKVYTIKKINIAINETAKNAAFNGTNHAYVINGTDSSEGNFVISYSSDNGSNYTSTIPTNAGSYYVKIERTSDKNYNAYSKVITNGLVITPITIAIDWCTDSFTYNGTTQTITANYKDIANVDVPLTVTVDNEFKEVGSYTATAVTPTDTNYVLPALVTKGYTINQKEIVIDWCADSFTYNGSTQVITATYKDVTNIDIPLTVTVDNEFKEVGSYTATASFASATANYKLPSSVTKAYTMSAQATTSPIVLDALSKKIFDLSNLKWNYSDSFTYDGKAHSVDVVGSLPEGLAILFISNNTKTDAGDYVSEVTFSYDSTQYEEPVFESLNWKINKKEVSEPTIIGVQSQSYTQGNDNLVFNGANAISKADSEDSYVAANMYEYNGEALTLVLSGVEDYLVTTDTLTQTNKGLYTITYNLINDNYEWASGSDGVINWEIYETIKEIKAEEPVIDEAHKDVFAEDKPIAKVSMEEGELPITLQLVVEVAFSDEIDSKISNNELTVDYYNLSQEEKALAENEKVGIVYDIKLYRNGEEVSVEEFAPGEKIRVQILMPNGVSTDNITKIMHVHSESEIDVLTFDHNSIDDEGYVELKVDGFSEFAMIYAENSESQVLHFPIWIIILIVLIVLFIIFIIIKRTKDKTKEKEQE